MSQHVALIVPVKTLRSAKTRLGRPGRAELMRAFALDAIAAASTSPAVAHVYVVSDEDGLVDASRVLPDRGHGDLNAALRSAADEVRRRHPGLTVAAMCADLPSLRGEDLTTALTDQPFARWFVADAQGTGTTLLVAAPGEELDPRFGAGSARRHEESGAAPLLQSVASLRRDVDTAEDLEHARALGLGQRTAALLSP